ncbi:serine/threonine-protein kinase STY8 isoform X2 [Selaginella moellendorffii]|uniref:serine/threonine-protein kinase STY8 isoform X2 n=1 Tax=Selaginella moellendorffii TaxID=88036 RepID=UPI000D1C8125|nr:serine/threonine-protein kinase STY8 isoform X2 [Selaginella moellendorffii]|eukprot:XP_024526089.1 serine/threonine-protein kinase STY8 isoform X2 [Selaginella moellendorffii]
MEVDGSENGCDANEAMDWAPHQQHRNTKQEVLTEILQRLVEEGHEEASEPGFADELRAHFARLPTRYASDVRKDRAQVVLIHKKMLEEAENPKNLPVLYVRAVSVERPDASSMNSSPADSPSYSPSSKADSHSPPAFEGRLFTPTSSMCSTPRIGDMQMHEVTFSTVDKPKLLSKLSTILADVNLHVWEAHIFSTIDGYSLDVFVVYGWHTENIKDLEQALRNSVACMEEGVWLRSSPSTSPSVSPSSSPDSIIAPQAGTNGWKIPLDAPDDWEIDSSQLKRIKKILPSSNGDIYRGTFCGQDVAIKVIKPETWTEHLQEFVHEIAIMRKVRHKNIVQFIGACTTPPDLCIVTEYMSGGTVHDYLQKQKGNLHLYVLLRIALDIAKGMDYLHQNNIIHRDLKASSLLMDENGVVKVADFGVARIQDQDGIMTAETGTYRWMAPEVLGHSHYDQKADVFSFGVLLWELLTKKVPYELMTPFQVAVGVLQEELRPTIPQDAHPKFSQLLEWCWRTNPADRPDFSEITLVLKDIMSEIEESSPRERSKQPQALGFFSLKRGSKVL